MGIFNVGIGEGRSEHGISSPATHRLNYYKPIEKHTLYFYTRPSSINNHTKCTYFKVLSNVHELKRNTRGKSHI